MSQPHSACPICDAPIEDSTVEWCSKCKWVMGLNNSLTPKMRDRLIKWSRHYYNSTLNYANEIEKMNRDEYDRKKIENRLNRQRDDIDFLRASVPQILTSIEEIKFILKTRGSKIDLDDDIHTQVITSIDNLDREHNLAAPEIQETINTDEYDLISAKKELNSQTAELTKSQQEIVSEYYHNLSQFAVKYHVKIANVTKDSISSNRGNEEKVVILEETSRGNYWVFNFEDCNYLVPVEGKYINQHSYTTTSTIFQGHNYTPDYQKIQLVKPAIVSIDLNTSPQTWRLQQQGELVFL